jgi:hypothetical protein
MVAAFAAVLLAVVVFQSQPAVSQPIESPNVAKWEYTTETIEADSLQAKLTALGNAGWEVFLIARADLVLEKGTDDQSHIVVAKYELTGRRRAR